jgi:hypothetical protein
LTGAIHYETMTTDAAKQALAARRSIDNGEESG